MFSRQYCARSGCCSNNGASQYAGEGFYHAFTQAGYSTCCVGKMHHAKDLYGAMGFEKRLTQEELSNPQVNYTRFLMNSPWRNVFDYNGQRSEMHYIPQISQLPAEYHPTRWVADKSLEFLENPPKDKPFFLMSSFIHPPPAFRSARALAQAVPHSFGRSLYAGRSKRIHTVSQRSLHL